MLENAKWEGKNMEMSNFSDIGANILWTEFIKNKFTVD
jgi:hypothetical protein